ncbi:aminotransferase class I/II-fold pyridoxal phosphate-dependent enzyme [Lachnospiraceae bacterium WCA-9-b2]|uniref:Aminotransferase class I/II-fold pyridoxal phosphate-dependent enzyme n=1 Tax=Sporofaciens musculi TaxID=2681861 RepID=A0A7X3MD82_9FIRM|nr:aminotransferase class I/II-fold pyridoxal phosphate-dependent enzyme [Sporofaciens musculi]MXP74268.1 aminotransferase class I/II-fold pyridoxal phosphate-dependent enzyme [Sporofaciens musculi]
MGCLYNRLREYSRSDYYGFHMPGHKRQLNMLGSEPVYSIDITEIEGFDDLHHAEGLLKSAQERAAKVYHGEETHFLINGSSVGILSAVAGVTKRGDTVLVARNCHKSVYHAIEMNGLNPVYLAPGFHASMQMNTEVFAEDVKAALRANPKIRAVVIVSPTYEGVISDVEAIVGAAHEKGIPVIVDEAHGAHFGFHSYFPENSNKKGADIVIHSLHKTLPSLTQTALLHINGKLVRREKVRRFIHMLQSSSPSYILMASMDSCIEMLENRRQELFEPYVRSLQALREELQALKGLKLVWTDRCDPSKLVISGEDVGLTGKMLYRILLEKYHLQMEMAAGKYVLAMTTVGDTQEGFRRLSCALSEIDEENRRRGRESLQKTGNIPCLPAPDVVYNSSEIEEMLEHFHETGVNRVEARLWRDSVGYVSVEYAYLYPPGIPLIVPGERVSQEAADMLQWYYEMGFSIEGLKRDSYIEVLAHG